MAVAIACARSQLAGGEVAVTVIDRLELAAVDGNDRLREQIQLAALQHKLLAHLANSLAVVAAQIGNRLELRCQATDQPHQLDVALGLAFQPPA